MPTRRALRLSATCRSMWRRTAWMSGPARRSSSWTKTWFPPRWPAARRMASPPPVSYGATRCLTGTLWLPTAMPGGCAASAICAASMMWCASTTSAGSRDITPSPTATRPPNMAAGAKAPAMRCLLPSRKSWVAPALSRRIWAF